MNRFNIKPYLFIISSVIIFSSCAIHTGSIAGSSFSIDPDRDFKIVDVARGNEMTTQVLGIGGLSKETMVSSAKQNMYLNYPLKKGQFYGMMTVDFKVTYMIFATTRKVTVTADIIDFDSLRYSKTSGQHIVKEDKGLEEVNGFTLGEEILFNKKNELKTGTITKLTSNSVMFKYLDNDRNTVVLSKKSIHVFKKGSNRKNIPHSFKVNDKVQFLDSDLRDGQNTLSGTVLGYNYKYLLINTKNETKRVHYTQVVN